MITSAAYITQSVSLEDRISCREKEVLQLISEGLTVKEIASVLFLSEHTIVSHKKNLTSKFKARNAIDLIVKAIKLGYVAI